MDKPLTVRADEFSQSVIFLANNSGLPAFVLSGILKDIQVELVQMAQKQLREDNDRWNAYQKEKEAENADT